MPSRLLFSQSCLYGMTQVEVERLRSFFYYERLPYEFGWKPSTVEFGGPTQVFAGIAKLLEYYNKYQVAVSIL